jgi:hypothetical protein
LQKGSLKLQRHLLRGQADYLLLAVRAAVAGGAGEVKITLNYKRVQVEFLLDDERLSEMMSGFVRSEDERSRAAQLLHLSVGGAFDQEIPEVQISWPGLCLTADENTLKGEPFEGRPGIVNITFDRSGLGFLTGRKRTACEHREVSSRCAYSSVPVSLDGRLLSGGPASIPSVRVANSGLPDGLILVDAYLRYGPDILPVSPWSGRVCAVQDECSPENRRNHLWEVRPGSVFFRIVEKSAGAVFYLNSLYGKGSLVVVKDGVCLEPIEEKFWMPGSTMVVRAESIETDITQLQPRESKELETLRAWVTKQNRRIGEELSKEVSLLRGHPIQVPGRTLPSLVGGGMGLMWGVVGGPACAVVMGGLGALVGRCFAGRADDEAFMKRIAGYLSRFGSIHPRPDSGKVSFSVNNE